MNIAEKLRNLPKGNILYSPALGDVIFKGIVKNKIVVEDYCSIERTFLYDGRFCPDGECVLFPSRENRDWSTFNLNKFDVSSLKPFDRVLVRDLDTDYWKAGIYSHYAVICGYRYVCVANLYRQCVPYNDDTKHLVGTKENCSDYYKTW